MATVPPMQFQFPSQNTSTPVSIPVTGSKLQVSVIEFNILSVFEFLLSR